MRGKWISTVAAVMMVLGLAVPVGAAGAGEIRVTLDFGDGQVHDGAVLFSPVAYPEGEHFRLADAFGGGLVKRDDAVSDALAQWLAESLPREGNTRFLDADGSACFTGLEPGLYLLAQDGNIENLDPFRPILIPLPSSGQWQLTVFPQTRSVRAQIPQTGEPPRFPAEATLLLSAAGLALCCGGFFRNRKKTY